MGVNNGFFFFFFCRVLCVLSLSVFFFSFASSSLLLHAHEYISCSVYRCHLIRVFSFLFFFSFLPTASDDAVTSRGGCVLSFIYVSPCTLLLLG